MRRSGRRRARSSGNQRSPLSSLLTLLLATILVHSVMYAPALLVITLESPPRKTSYYDLWASFDLFVEKFLWCFASCHSSPFFRTTCTFVPVLTVYIPRFARFYPVVRDFTRHIGFSQSRQTLVEFENTNDPPHAINSLAQSPRRNLIFQRFR